MWIPDGGVSVTTASDFDPALIAPVGSVTSILRFTSGRLDAARSGTGAKAPALSAAKSDGAAATIDRSANRAIAWCFGFVFIEISL
jgi:hypothetical protein